MQIISKSDGCVGGSSEISEIGVSCQTQCDQCSRIHSFPSGGMRPVALSCSQRGRSHRQGQGNRGTDPFPHGGRSHLLLEKASPYLYALAPARCGSRINAVQGTPLGFVGETQGTNQRRRAQNRREVFVYTSQHFPFVKFTLPSVCPLDFRNTRQITIITIIQTQMEIRRDSTIWTSKNGLNL